MRTERCVIYVPDATVKEARLKGLTNLSEFVRTALKEYIKKHSEYRERVVPIRRE